MSYFKMEHLRCVTKSELCEFLIKIGKSEAEVEITPIQVISENAEEYDGSIHNNYFSVAWKDD